MLKSLTAYRSNKRRISDVFKNDLRSKTKYFSVPEQNKCYRLELDQPILKNEEISSILSIDKLTNGKLKSSVIDILFKNSQKGNELEEGIEKICYEAKSHIKDGSNILVLSDKNISSVNAPIPALLAASAIHHFLIKEGLRMKTSLIMETGEARELHHFSFYLVMVLKRLTLTLHLKLLIT